MLFAYSIERHKQVYKSLSWDRVLVVMPYVGGYRASFKEVQPNGEYAIVRQYDLCNKAELQELIDTL